jgi:hypothetical protein
MSHCGCQRAAVPIAAPGLPKYVQLVSQHVYDLSYVLLLLLLLLLLLPGHLGHPCAPLPTLPS